MAIITGPWLVVSLLALLPAANAEDKVRMTPPPTANVSVPGQPAPRAPQPCHERQR
jgi:hypothetical protein